ncbi:MAG TPA: hypothetical protein PKX92_04455 [Edaphocola sp.]|nr:hypothetical protein [Edaphocola sp.]
MKISIYIFACLLLPLSFVAAQPYYSNSNLKVRMASANLPNQTSPNWSGFIPYMLFSGQYLNISDYYQELNQQNDMLLGNPDGNPFFHTSNLVSNFYTNLRDSVLPWHYGKFFLMGQAI